MIATCYFRILQTMRFPVEGVAGEYLAVMPPPCPENLWVHEASGLWVVRRRHFPEAKLWTTLADLMDDGTLVMLHAPARQLLPHLLRAGDVSPPQALRVLRTG